MKLEDSIAQKNGGNKPAPSPQPDNGTGLDKQGKKDPTIAKF